MRHELISIDAYRLAIDAAQSIKELEDIAYAAGFNNVIFTR